VLTENNMGNAAISIDCIIILVMALSVAAAKD
jgi:hypothetical protein